MTKITKEAVAGTLESSDVLVRISPASDSKISLSVQSIVMQQFGDEISRVVQETLQKMGVKQANVEIDDKGALDCVIKARVQAAVLRASEATQIEWSKLS